MAYSNQIPQATDRINDSQLALLNNFIAIDSLVAVNHEPFNSANQGKHKFITLTDQTGTVPPVPVIGATEASIFYGTYNAVKDLYYQIGAGTPKSFGAPTGVGGVNGWLRLQNGMLMKWCQVLGSGDCTLTWATVMPGGTPNFTTIFHVQACPYVINPHFNVPTNRFVQVIGELTDPLTLRLYVSERTTMTAAQAECSIFAIGY
jgi:hypothetical protein